MSPDEYRGRFAPSPTGHLHFGSLVAALGSYLDARARNGRWLLRMEDLDRTREVPGAADDILRTLDSFGFEWDGPVVYQSGRADAYQSMLERLLGEGLAFPCGCTRKQVAAAGRPRTLTADMVREGAVVIDVGVNRVEDPSSKRGYRLVGDVDFDALMGHASALTPVPGGVGPMTIAMLLENTWEAMARKEGLDGNG